jgi:hypothetical protein
VIISGQADRSVLEAVVGEFYDEDEDSSEFILGARS